MKVGKKIVSMIGVVALLVGMMGTSVFAEELYIQSGSQLSSTVSSSVSVTSEDLGNRAKVSIPSSINLTYNTEAVDGKYYYEGQGDVVVEGVLDSNLRCSFGSVPFSYTGTDTSKTFSQYASTSCDCNEINNSDSFRTGLKVGEITPELLAAAPDTKITFTVKCMVDSSKIPAYDTYTGTYTIALSTD